MYHVCDTICIQYIYDTICICIAVWDRHGMINGEYCDQKNIQKNMIRCVYRCGTASGCSTASTANKEIKITNTMCICIQVRDRLWMLNGEYCDQLRIYDLKNLVINPQQEFVGKKILNSSRYSDFTQHGADFSDFFFA